MIIKTVKTLRNHWKKTVFFTGLTSYVSHYFYTNHKIDCLMREHCQNALKFGEERLNVFAQPKHITVILNPRSKKSKSKKYFNNYVAPILHCAGYKVSVVETERQGQAVQLMEIMSNTDAVLIAGGSGTIQEAITGLLRRADADQYAQNLVVGFVPLGTNNRTFFQVYEDLRDLKLGSKRLEEVQVLVNSTMKVLNDQRTNLNVLRIHNLDSQKTVFSLNKFEFGVLSELSRQLPKYWYLGDFLAQYYVYLKSVWLRNLSKFELGPALSLNYTEKCAGCSRCFNEFRNPKLEQAKQRSGGWFSMFRSVDQKRSDQLALNLEAKMKRTVNPACGQWKTMTVDRLMNVQIENSPRSEQPELKLKILQNSGDLTGSKFFDYLKNYPIQGGEDGGQCSLQLSVRDLRFDISKFNPNQADSERIGEHATNASDTQPGDTRAGDTQTSNTQADDMQAIVSGRADGSSDKAPGEQDKSNRLNYLIDDESYDVKNNLEVNSKFRKILTFS